MRVGYIGLGNMGRPMATNVARGGHDLLVYDIRDEAMQRLAEVGARIAQAPREVGEHAEVVEISVVDDAQVETVVLGEDGVLEGAAPGTIIAVHSTIHPDTVRRLAEHARPGGVEVLDAQVSGGQGGAWAQTLCYMVGGDRAAFERCQPVFATSGKHIFYMGELGMGAAAKIAQQIITTVTMLAVSEGTSVAARAGVDLETFGRLVAVSAGQSYIADNWLARYLQMDDHLIELFYQGLRPALALGHELGLSLPGTALTQQLFPKILGGLPREDR